jgi:hypothetical protein
VTASSRPKLADVRYQEVTYHPVADCEGRWGVGDDGADVLVEQCAWRLRPEPFGIDPSEFKKEARRHALAHPGHSVTVTRRTVASYWLPVPDPTETETEKVDR